MKIKPVSIFAAALLANTPAMAEGLKIQNSDLNLQFGGRIQYDYNRSEENNQVDEDDFNLRRGRLFVKGNISENWSFKTQFNVDGSGAEDLYLRYNGFDSGQTITIGNQNMPFGLEELTSSKDISVLERSAITELFAVGKAEGIQFNGALGNQTYALGLFTDNDVDSEKGFAARYTFSPVKTQSSVLHLGVAYKNISDDQALGLEAAFATGPFHIQAEYTDGTTESNNDASGYYVQAGYIFTGETRPYKGGKFKRVSPSSKSGAWEAVARYEDGDGNHSDIELGTTDATAYTIGLNYYANKNVRLGINYTDGEDNNSNDTGNELRLRFQVTF
ncbi:OprO/OprP family phosphate-selective porin [Pelagibaculum spongiae]|uniref:ATPase n=1 Tax=Pelagibaculum spongiae TaxID=2080658 RepID=A0A2V1GWM3_9GAMM|nr:porin [Pelagibaculum spongiae]PVZ65429.1 ATPase [Pelagibaculum spongiae]